MKNTNVEFENSNKLDKKLFLIETWGCQMNVNGRS